MAVQVVALAPIHGINSAFHTTFPLSIANGGVNLTAYPKVPLIIHAGAWIGNVTTGAGDANGLAERWELGTTLKRTVSYITFAANERASAEFQLPDNYDGGTFAFRFIWGAPSGSGTLIMGLSLGIAADGDSLNPDTNGWGTEVTVTDTLIAANAIQVSPESTAVTPSNTPAAGKLLLLDLKRTGGTLGVDGRIVAIILEYTVNSYSV